VKVFGSCLLIKGLGFAMQIPNKQQVQALSEDLRSRSKIPGAKFIASQIFLLS
jgi:hypothetical protein